MKSFNINLSIVFAVVFVFIKHSQGSVPESFAALAEMEKIAVGQQFQAMQEAEIMAGNDTETSITKATIEYIQNNINNSPVRLLSPKAVDKSVEGVLKVIRLCHFIFSKALKAMDLASEKIKRQEFDGAIDVIKKELKDRENIFIAGVPINSAQGAILAIAGAPAMPGLSKSIFFIVKAGGAAFESLKIVEEMTKSGIKAGGVAAENSLKAAKSVILTGLSTVCEYLSQAAMHAVEGVEVGALQTRNEVDLLPGILNSLKLQFDTDNYAALNATSKISNGLKSILSVLTKKPAIDAANLICEGLKSSILKVAEAIAHAKSTVLEAGKIAEQEPEAAITFLRKGIRTAYDEVQKGAAFVYLGMGAASEIAGKEITEEFVADIIEIEYGVALTFEDLELVERTAIVGIRGGKSARDLGINGAQEMCDAAGQLLFQNFVEVAENAYESLKHV